MKDVELPRLGLRKLRSPGVQRVLDGLKRCADLNGMPTTGRFVQYGTPDNGHQGVVLGHAPSHPGEADYSEAFPDQPTAPPQQE